MSNIITEDLGFGELSKTNKKSNKKKKNKSKKKPSEHVTEAASSQNLRTEHQPSQPFDTPKDDNNQSFDNSEGFCVDEVDKAETDKATEELEVKGENVEVEAENQSSETFADPQNTSDEKSVEAPDDWVAECSTEPLTTTGEKNDEGDEVWGRETNSEAQNTTYVDCKGYQQRANDLEPQQSVKAKAMGGQKGRGQHSQSRDDGYDWQHTSEHKRATRGGGGRGSHPQGYKRNYGPQNYSQGGGWGGYDSYSSRNNQRSYDDKKTSFSRSLSSILRHRAHDFQLDIDSAGYVNVEDILSLPRFKGCDEKQIIQIVEEDAKNRFNLRKIEGRLQICANQGHSIEVEDLELTEITDASEYDHVVHGTYTDPWFKFIKNEGLCRMKRQYIHFCMGEPGDKKIISGARQSANVLIYINLAKALADGFKFYRSVNDVILCPGDKDGILPPKYFRAVKDRYKNCLLQPIQD